jgi:hypothetical protein
LASTVATAYSGRMTGADRRLVVGGGAWSVDAWFSRRRERHW